MPRVVETDSGPHWIAEGKDLGVYGGLGFGFTKPARGHSKHVDEMYDAGFYDGGPHPTTPDLRYKDMQIDGIEAEVIYGILGVGLRFEGPPDDECCLRDLQQLGSGVLQLAARNVGGAGVHPESRPECSRG